MSADGSQMGRAGEAGAGLVTSTTKSTDAIEISTREARLNRMRRGVKQTAVLAADIQGRKAAMVTLTYRPGRHPQANDVRDFLKCVVEFLRRRGHHSPYCWVAELQSRGVLHYHVLIWLPRGISLPKPDKRGWWPHGHTRIEWARKPISYLTKYASKLKTKTSGEASIPFPKHFRMHGSGGFDAYRRSVRAYRMLPMWVRERATVEDRIRRRVGGGFFSKATGEIFESPWRITARRFVAGVGWVVSLCHVGAAA